VVDVRIVHIDLPEPCDPLIYARLPEKAESAVIPNVIFESWCRQPPTMFSTLISLSSFSTPTRQPEAISRS
jgi:hypothetical protein